jgi:hypothetical protein
MLIIWKIEISSWIEWETINIGDERILFMPAIRWSYITFIVWHTFELECKSISENSSPCDWSIYLRINISKCKVSERYEHKPDYTYFLAHDVMSFKRLLTAIDSCLRWIRSYGWILVILYIEVTLNYFLSCNHICEVWQLYYYTIKCELND